jgi:hypothetical protein
MNIFERAFLKIEIDRNDLPTHIPDRPIISKEKIPQELSFKLNNVLSKMSDCGMDMPFLHITTSDILDPDGNIRSTGFANNINKNGLKKNTNGTCFVSRDQDKKWSESNPKYFLDHPEILIENLRLIVKNYFHHGVRTNKKVLGFTNKGGKRADYEYAGKGLAYMFVTDATGITRRHGKDGIEHYQILQKIDRNRIMGGFKLGGIDIKNEQQLLNLFRQFLLILENYLLKKAAN